jgi:hypothetical protein
MPRKLKVYQTSQGFYDLAIAAPSMKAALEAWGANSNLFHQGFATEAKDDDVIEAAMAKPGIVLQRPVGSNKPFKEHSDLPTAASLDDAPRKPRAEPKKASRTKAPKTLDKKASERAAAAYERERQRQEKQRQKEEAAAAKERERREAAVSKAEAALDEARQEHNDIKAALDGEREELDKQAAAEEKRWDTLRERLERAVKQARS